MRLDLDNLRDGSGNGRHLMLGGPGAPAVAADPWGIGLDGLAFAGGHNAVADGAGFALPGSNGDYTWEFRFRRDAGHLATGQVVFGRWGGPSNNNYLCYFDTSNRLNYLVGDASNSSVQTTLQTAALTTSAARAVAVVKSSGSLSLYLDGTRVAGPTANTTPNPPLSTLPFRVGDYDDPSTSVGLPLWGTIGDLRFSSTARYTGSSYAVPTSALASDGSTIALLPMSAPAGTYLGTPAYQGHALLRTGYTQASGGWANPDGPWPTLDGRWAFSVSGYNGTQWTVWAVVADTLAGLLAGSGTVQAAAIQTPATGEGSIAGNGTVYPWGGTYHHWYHDAAAGGTRLRHSTGSSLGSAFSAGTTLFGPDATFTGGYTDPFVRPDATGTGLEMILVGLGVSTARTMLRSTSSDGVTWTTPATLADSKQPGYTFAVGEPAHVGGFSGTARWLLADGSPGAGTGRSVLAWGTQDGSTWRSLRRLFGGSGGSYVAAYDASPWYDAANARLVVLAADSTNTLQTQPTDSDVGVWYVPLVGYVATAEGTATLAGSATLAATGTATYSAPATLVGATALTVTGSSPVEGSAALVGSGTLVAAGAIPVPGLPPATLATARLASAPGMLAPSLRFPPMPGGDVADQADREQLAGVYRGVLAVEPGPIDAGINPRMSALAMLTPSLRFAPAPGGDVADQSDREQLAGVYSGVLATGLGPVLGTATLRGTATLAATGTASYRASAALAGTATLAASGSPSTAAVATLVGTGTLTTYGHATYSATATLTASGTLAASLEERYFAAATLVGVGTLGASGVVGGAGVASLAGSGILSASGKATYSEVATLAGTGTLAADGIPVEVGAGTVALVGGGTLAVSGTGGVAYSASGTLAGVGTLAATGRAVYSAPGTLASSGTLVASGTVVAVASVALVAPATLVSYGRASYSTSGTLAATGTLLAAGTPIHAGTVALVGGGTLVAGGAAVLSGSGSLASEGTLAASGLAVYSGSATLVGTATLTATVGAGSYAAAATLGGGGTLRANGVAAYSSGPITLTSSLTIDAAPPVGPFPLPPFLEALRVRILAHPTQARLTDVYLTTSPPGAVYPFMVLNRLWQSPTINTSSSYYKEVAVQFTAISQDAEEVAGLADDAYDALFPDPSNPPIAFAGGYEMTRLPGMSHGPTADTAGRTGGDWVWRASFDYTFMIGKG